MRIHVTKHVVKRWRERVIGETHSGYRRRQRGRMTDRELRKKIYGITRAKLGGKGIRRDRTGAYVYWHDGCKVITRFGARCLVVRTVYGREDSRGQNKGDTSRDTRHTAKLEPDYEDAPHGAAQTCKVMAGRNSLDVAEVREKIQTANQESTGNVAVPIPRP